MYSCCSILYYYLQMYYAVENVCCKVLLTMVFVVLLTHKTLLNVPLWSFAGITVLLSLTVFMLLVAEIMPATSDSVPLIGTTSLTSRLLFQQIYCSHLLWGTQSYCLIYLFIPPSNNPSSAFIASCETQALASFSCSCC